MLDYPTIYCPACGEPQTMTVDTSAGSQRYIEDCQVCCRPMNVDVRVDEDGVAQVRVGNDDD